MKKFVFVFLLFLVNWTFAKIVFDFTGKVVKVDDGDTIWVETSNLDYKIRILGIDAPEIIEPSLGIKKYKFYGCGREAKQFAEKLLSGKVVKIYYDTLAKNKDKYGRLLRYVFIPYKYKDKKYWLPYGAFAIYKGWAKVYKYEDFVLKRIYYKLEDIAKKKRRGIWSSKCQLEDKLIKERYLLNLSPRQKQDKDGRIDNRNIDFNSCGYTYHKKGCDIKGNINRKGVKIYHLPGRKYYDKTIITPSKGERRFCSEDQARRCGWRPSYAR